jgi:tripartite-type tricarboxylate transporter receptor subunit TctC
MKRFFLLGSLSKFFVAVLVLAPAAQALAQGVYPARTIRLVVDTSPGGVTDIFARMAADGLASRVGQAVVVDNRPGSSGDLAIDYMQKAAPDGYTLMIAAGGNLLIKPFLKRAQAIDPLADFVPVFNFAEAPHILVVPGTLPVKNLAEFIAYARANQGKISYGSAGTGSPPHLAVELLGLLAGLQQMVHVPYKGVGPALPDLIAGRLQVMSISVGSARPYLKGGTLRPLAAGSKHRLAVLPDVPTSAEAGLPGWEMAAWFGVFGPKDTGPQIVRVLNEKLQAVIEDPKTKQRLQEIGAEPIGGPQSTFVERVRADFRMLGRLVKDTGVKLE